MYRSHKVSNILDEDGKIFRTRRIFRQWKSKFEEINRELKLKMAAVVKYYLFIIHYLVPCSKNTN